jgi:CheY-like chemotaxis protein
MLYDSLPDLIVLDLMMPEMGGAIFLRMLRNHSHWKDLPVLVLTGLDPDEALVQSAKSFGVVDVIHKGSYSIDLLLHRVTTMFPDTRTPIYIPPRTRTQR